MADPNPGVNTQPDPNAHRRPATPCIAWAGLAIAAIASAALGCGGGGSGSVSDAVGDLGDELNNNEDLQNDLNNFLNNLDPDDVDPDDLEDLFDNFDDDDGDGIPDAPSDVPDDLPDLSDFLADDTSLSGTFTGSGEGLAACGFEPNLGLSSASVSFTFDGSGNVAFTVELVSSTIDMTNTTTSTTVGTGASSSLGDGRILVSGPATATTVTETPVDTISQSFESFGLYIITNVNTDAPAFDLCSTGAVLIPLSQ